ncbi:MAG: glycerate kinase, partial [Actinomycetota bacterium]
QTAYGKVPLGVARLAKAKNIPVIAIGGQVTEDAVVLKDYGITELYLLMKPGMSVEEAMKHASRLLEDKVAEVLHGLYETKVW